ncbi:Uncharacterised protein [Mycobacteroides abscessus subsp. abscessus]|nr:Uncharacterised protein [Mycobacteroides abscessus subsp. abscessus]SKT90916.1 Uncharacterised protein [Mycobacteroides abscessus subsp. abscessus]
MVSTGLGWAPARASPMRVGSGRGIASPECSRVEVAERIERASPSDRSQVASGRRTV